MARANTKAAEVTRQGIKARGSPQKGAERITVVNGFSTANIKKKLLYLGTSVMAASVYTGICSEGIEWVYFKDAMYLTSFLYGSMLLTLLFSKVE